MQDMLLSPIRRPAADASGVEIVERKGLGHPDTICDSLAEEFSLALSQFYLDRFGLVLHHNVDKALLCGGASRSAYGGGAVLSPIEVYLSGRATAEFKGVPVPIEELARASSLSWLRSRFHALDPEKHVRIHVHTRPGSADLVQLYLRQRESGLWLANDTSCGVGYAPLSKLEQIVLAVERRLNEPSFKTKHPETGEDIKVLGVRTSDGVVLTVACAFVDRFVSSRDDYLAKKKSLVDAIRAIVEAEHAAPVEIFLNAADEPGSDNVFLTVTATSAEAGDDGEVGRGNRANGLITPYRPMTMEATAGKNPITHVGKLYNVAAMLIADAVVHHVPEVAAAECYLVSAIGSPVNEPRVVDIKVEMTDAAPLESVRPQIETVAGDLLSSVDTLWKPIIERRISLF